MSLPETESKILRQIDTTGISQAQFFELIAFCSKCRTYMTKMSIVFHRQCHGPRVTTRGRLLAESSQTESPTKTLLRLIAYVAEPLVGISETKFCSLFSKCPRCSTYMTWDAARHHSCLFDEMAMDLDDEEYSGWGSSSP